MSIDLYNYLLNKYEAPVSISFAFYAAQCTKLTSSSPSGLYHLICLFISKTQILTTFMFVGQEARNLIQGMAKPDGTVSNLFGYSATPNDTHS